MLTYVFVKSCIDLSDPANSESGNSWLGLGPPLVIGGFFLVLGVVLMIAGGAQARLRSSGAGWKPPTPRCSPPHQPPRPGRAVARRIRRLRPMSATAARPRLRRVFALAAAGMWVVMSAGASGFQSPRVERVSPPTGAIIDLDFGNISGSTVPDGSGNANDGAGKKGAVGSETSWSPSTATDSQGNDRGRLRRHADGAHRDPEPRGESRCQSLLHPRAVHAERVGGYRSRTPTL